MAYNFLRDDRDQPFLLPPDLRDWLPDGHLAWFVLDVVDQLDLAAFSRAHRNDGHGHPAYDPRLLLGVLLYAYCTGVRSSRQIQRCCHEDLAFRVLAGNQAPDHVTIARFRVRHEQALAEFLVQSLRLCAAAGLVRLGVVALDGTKIEAKAADRANRTLAKLEEEVTQILRQAAETDQAEDCQHGPAQGDELPAELASPTGGWPGCSRPGPSWKPRRPNGDAATSSGWSTWPRARIKPRRRDEAPDPTATANTADPDSRFVRGNGCTLQGYNAQAVATADQVVVAAALTQQANDVQPLAPMLTATTATLAAAGITARPGQLAADSGYWSIANLTSLPGGPELLIPPARHGRHGKPRKDGRPSESRSDGLRAAWRARLGSDVGKASYGLRSQTIEPVFGQLKTVQGAQRFIRRGLAACEPEWKLLCGSHTLLKLWRQACRQAATTPLA